MKHNVVADIRWCQGLQRKCSSTSWKRSWRKTKTLPVRRNDQRSVKSTITLVFEHCWHVGLLCSLRTVDCFRHISWGLHFDARHFYAERKTLPRAEHTISLRNLELSSFEPFGLVTYKLPSKLYALKFATKLFDLNSSALTALPSAWRRHRRAASRVRMRSPASGACRSSCSCGARSYRTHSGRTKPSPTSHRLVDAAPSCSVRAVTMIYRSVSVLQTPTPVLYFISEPP